MLYVFNYKYIDGIDKISKEVMVIELKEVEESKISYLVKYDKNNFLLNIYNRAGESVDKETFGHFNYGDIIKINGKINIPKLLNNPNEFNYKRYLNSNKIVGYINTYSAAKVGEKYGNLLLKNVYNFRRILGEKINNNLPEDKANLLKSMIYGESINIDEKIENNLTTNGLSHIIAVSGTNISYLLMLLTIVFDDDKKKSRLYFSLIIVAIFCAMASFSISILRATIMSTISTFCKFFNITIKKYTSVILSAIIIYLYNPFCIFNIGFIFSYLAVIGIITYQSEIYSLFDIKIKRMLRYNYVENNKNKIGIYKFLMLISKIIALYISVQILVLPVQIYYFSKFSITAIISNILVYPIISVIFFLGFLILFLSFIPFISNILFNCEYLMLNLLIGLSNYLVKFEMPIIIPKPNLVILLLYYIFLILFRYRKKVILIVKRKNVKVLKISLNILYTSYIIYTFCYYINIIYLEDYIYFFNVNQGNMAFIRYNRKNILVDYGSTTKNLASNVLINFCKQKGISNIDLLFVTHMHDDHVNGIFNNKNEIKIDKVVYSYPKEENENFEKLKIVSEQKNISKLESNIFDTYVYDDLEILILSPKNNDKIIADDIENANSQVLLFSIKNKNILFMGDATCETEKNIIKNIQDIEDIKLRQKLEERLKNIDLFQVGHHGSKTSTSKDFLEYINVKKAIISAQKEKYGHPHQETIDKLNEYNISIYCTENSGALKISI